MSSDPARWLPFFVAAVLLCITASARAAIRGPVLCEPLPGNFDCGTRLAGASVSIEPPFYNYGVRISGSGASAAKAFTVTNTGEVSLSAGWTAVDFSSPEGPDPEAFAISSDDCGSLPPRSSCVIEVLFNPTRPGVDSGLLIFADATRSTYAIAQLEGAGQTVSIWPLALMFQPREVGSGNSPSEEVTVTNESETEEVKIYNVTVTNQTSSAGDFRITGGTCTTLISLPPNGKCTVAVSFSPKTTANVRGTLTVIDDAPGGEQLSSLEGTGLAGSSSTPQLRIFRRPARLTTMNRATFGFGVMGSFGTFECQLDTRPFVPCNSPIRFGGLKIGRHSFAVRLVDTNGDIAPSVTAYQWRIRARRRPR